MHHRRLYGGALISLAIEAWQVVCGEVQPDQILDIREPDLFARAHIPGAVNVPYGEVQDRGTQALDSTQTVLVVDPGGARAAEMAVWLRGQGFEASYLEGGMAAWTGDLQKPRRRRR